MNDSYYYEVNLLWNSDLQETIHSAGIASKIEVVSAPEFLKGKKKKWTHEQLFVAAANACLMSTFLLIADNSKFRFTSFESNAVGRIEKLDGKFAVTEIVLKPKLIIPSAHHERKAKRVLEMSEKACSVTGAPHTKILLSPTIIVQ